MLVKSWERGEEAEKKEIEEAQVGTVEGWYSSHGVEKGEEVERVKREIRIGYEYSIVV